MSKHGGLNTGPSEMPGSMASGANYAKAPAPDLGARGDSPAVPMPASPQGYQGPAEMPRDYNKNTAHISKLGPQS